MTRITRSQVHTVQTPLYQPSPLAEHDFSKAGNTIEDADVVSELKRLKAAYRVALGIAKRGKKTRNKKVQHTIEVLEYHNNSDSTLRSPVLDTAVQNHQENTRIQQQSQVHSPIGRTTRQQAAQEHAGQSNLQDVLVPEPDTSALAQRLRDLDYASLFPGPSTRSSIVLQPSANGEVYDGSCRTDQIAHLAEELGTLRQTPSQEQLGIRRTSEPHITQEGESKTPIAPKSPVKTLAEVEEAYGSVDSPAPAETEDSFVEQITSRSPAKPVARIEDSLEALDQLEEALEAVGEVALAKRVVSTVSENPRVTSRTSTNRILPLGKSKSLRAIKPEPVVSGPRKSNTFRGDTTKQGSGSMRTKPTAPKITPDLKKAVYMNFSVTKIERNQIKETTKLQPHVKPSAKRPLSLLPPKETVKSTKPLTRPTFELSGDAVARKLKEQREARVAQRSASEGSPPPARVLSDSRHKSTKPTTKAVFELSSAALSLRKKEALEARLKIQEDEERQRREFKAKPIRKSFIPDCIPRQTAASRARQSKMGLENKDGGDLSISKRSPSSGPNIGARRLAAVQPIGQANVSVPRAKLTALIAKQAPTTHGPSMSGRVIPRTVTSNNVQAQRQKAEEIYGRDAKWTEDIGREKRDREAAAKRAREEATEQGRQASREWAEKQLVRKITENDMMDPGFGPGGQLGLRS